MTNVLAIIHAILNLMSSQIRFCIRLAISPLSWLSVFLFSWMADSVPIWTSAGIAVAGYVSCNALALLAAVGLAAARRRPVNSPAALPPRP